MPKEKAGGGEETKEVVVSQREAEVSNFITQAIGANTPVETMEKLFALHREAKADFAREQFVAALSLFQKEIPVIKKNKKVLNKDARTVRYQYASLDSIAEQIKNAMAANGLSYTWEVENKPDFIKATCTITHKFGHHQTSSFEVPIGGDQYMTKPQAFASALTYAKRYSLCNALGLSTADEDTDATDVNREGEAKSPRSRIIFALRALGKDSDKWSKEAWAKQVKVITGIELVEKNFSEIANRLEVLVTEKNEHEDSKLQ